MSAVSAAWSLYWRRTDLLVQALAGCAVGATCVALAQWLAPVLESSQREGLVLIGLAFALIWVPVVVGAQLRAQIGDARERLLPSLGAHVRVALVLVASLYLLPLLAAMRLMRIDASFGLALGASVGALLWWAGWRQGRSLTFLLPSLVLALPGMAPWLRAGLHGGHPGGAGVLLGAAALVVGAVVAAGIRDVRSDRCRRPLMRHWLAELPIWEAWSRRAVPAWDPVGQRTWPWVKHLSRGWRAEMAHPLVLALIAGASTTVLAWPRMSERSALPEASDGALVAYGVGLMLWMASVGMIESAAMVRADVVRPVSRSRFATLLLLVVGRALARTWTSLWIGALFALWLVSGARAMLAAAPFALISLAMLPAFAGAAAGMLSMQRRWLVWVPIMAIGLLPAAVLIVESAMRHWGSAAVGIGAGLALAALGVAGCVLCHHRWRTMDLT